MAKCMTQEASLQYIFVFAINIGAGVSHVTCRSASSASQLLQQTFPIKFIIYSWEGAKPPSIHYEI